MKITKEEIIKIKKGEVRSYIVDSPAQAKAAHSMVYYVKRTCRPAGIDNYKVNVNYEENIVTIMAI